MGSARHGKARAALLIAAAAVAGVLLRIRVTDSFVRRVASANAALPPSLAANLLGSFVLGALHACGEYAGASVRLALGTGFAGSLTTFATAMFHAAQLFVRGRIAPGFTSLLLTVLASAGAYIAGTDLFSLFQLPSLRVRVRSEVVATVLCAAVFVVAWGGVVLAAGLDESPWRRARWLAAAWAPPGALLRWILSNLNSPEFPRGTLVANSAACAVDAVLASLLYRNVGGRDAAFWFTAMFTGFAGSLSTVSTFAAELRILKPGKRLGYALLSVLIAQALLLAIYGVVVWTA